MAITNSFRRGAFALVIIGTCIAACKKDDEAAFERHLPAITTDGRNVFACVMNNEWVYNVAGAYESPGMAITSTCKGGSNVGESSHSLTISSRDCPNADWHFEITIRDSAKIGQIFFGAGKENECLLTHTVSSGAGYNVLEFYRSSEGSGVVEFLRVDNEVCAGTFSFELKDEASGRMYSIANGRFDIARD